MNKLLPLLCLSLALSACSRTEKRLEAHVFVPDAVCAHTPALNQGRTSTCWTYASASLLESDWLAGHPGDTVRLSPMYMVRQKYLNQLDAYYYSCGREEIRNGGLGHSFLRVLEEDGVLPLEAYRGRRQGSKRHDHGALLKQLKKLAEEAVKHCDLPGYRKRAVALLDEQMGGGARFVSLPWQELYRPFVCRLASLQGGGLCAVDELHASSFLYPFYIGSTGQLGASVLFQPSAGRVGAGGAPCAVCRQDGGLAWRCERRYFQSASGNGSLDAASGDTGDAAT